ncbi:LysR family transcriptional regulator [Bradyrhizobium sp. Ash2021]
MDSRQLRYFIAVYEQRNLSRAADQANVAQSALSHHIRIASSIMLPEN